MTELCSANSIQPAPDKKKYSQNLIGDSNTIQILELPTDFSRSPLKKISVDSVPFQIPEQVFKLIMDLAVDQNFSFEELLLGAFSILLHRYSEQDSFYIGKVIATDNNSLELNTNFIQYINVHFSEDSDLHSVMSDIHQTITKKDSACIKELHLSSELDSAFVFISRALFSYFTAGSLSAQSAIISSEQIIIHCDADIFMEIVETSGQANCIIYYNSDLFKKEFLERMAVHFTTLLEDMCCHHTRKISALEIMTAQEKHMLLYTWNSTDRSIPESICIPELFEAQVTKTPLSTALLCDELTITYQELNSKANQLAHYLLKNGFKIEDPIVIYLDRTIDLIVAILGTLKAGCTYVPVDPVFPADHIQSIIDDCKPVMIITSDKYNSEFSQLNIRILSIDERSNILAAQQNDNLQVELTQNNRFYIMYTSGSTGKPKGVEGIYRGIINRLIWMWDTYPYGENDICCHKTSISFVDHIAEIFNPLLKGVPLVILNEGHIRNTASFIETLIKMKISRILLVPSLLHSILKLNTEKLKQLSDLRYVFCSGEALSVALAKRFYQNIRNVRLVNIYGSTEVSADVTFYEIKRFSVGDVLKYFTHSIDFPGGLRDVVPQGNISPIKADRITTENIPLDALSSKFTQTKLTDYPLTIEQYFKRLYTNVLPYVINTTAPTFIGHMTSALPDFVHDLSKLISQLNQNMVKIETAKSLVFLEREALAILHRSFYNRPDTFYHIYTQKINSNLGLVTTGGTTANITALLTARNKILYSQDMNTSGKSIYSVMHEKGYSDMTILGTQLMHYSMRKAISVLGLGIDNIQYISTDIHGRLNIEDLQQKIEYCKKNKILILAIIGIAGATETGQIDPLDKIGQIASQYGIHFHVDAAWGGTTVFSEKYKHKLHGIELADSITFCGHKQLYLPQGISICLFKDPEQLKYAATTARYQATADSYDTGKFTMEGSRSAISLCLHAALRLFGKKGYEALVDYSMELTRFFTKVIQQSDIFELIGTPELNIINYRYIPFQFRSKLADGTLSSSDNSEINLINKTIQENQFLSGKTFVSKTTLTHTKYGANPGIVVFRAVLSNPLTTYADLYDVLEDQIAIANEPQNKKAIVKFQNISLNELPVNTELQSIDASSEIMVSIGKPLYNCKTYILNKNLNPAPIGIPGDLYISGAALAKGYYNNISATKELFIPNPFKKDDLLFKTGDRARYSDDGTIDFLGRFDELVKFQGFRIELAEIEHHINQIENVQQNKVIVKTDSEGQKILFAYVVLKQAGPVENINKALQKKLPGYMIPSKYKVITTMPLMPNGKIDKKALLNM